MLSSKIKRFSLNPCLGLTPILVYFFSFLFLRDIQYSLIIALLYAVVAGTMLSLFSKVTRIGFHIIFVLLLITFLLWILTHEYITKYHIYLMIPEVLIVFEAIIMRFFKIFVRLRFYRKNNTPIQKLFYSEFLDSTIYAQYLFTLHIFVAVIYKLLEENAVINGNYDIGMFVLTPIAILITLIVVEHIKISKLSDRLMKEYWLPIVDENGGVKGKIARSVSVKLKNTHLHPVVRIALVCKGRLYIQPRNKNEAVDSSKLDHPFERYIPYSHDIDQVAAECIHSIIGKDLPHRFLLKYTFENELTKRLIFLYVVNICNDSEVEGGDSTLHGKFWTATHLDAEYGDSDVFAETFQLEYEYIKNVVLFADEIANGNQIVE